MRIVNQSRWFWVGVFIAGAILHFGTAVLRLNSFFPSPQALDFSSYYAGAWSLRWQLSPYNWSSELLAFLSETQQLNFNPPTHNSSPLWPLLLQPITLLNFPAAAILWLFILLLIVIVCHILLLKIAGYTSWKTILATLPITLTFGPLFLNLTLGQNGIFLLLSVLLTGIALERRERAFQAEIWTVLIWIIAVGAKVYPIIWIGNLPFLKRWRLLATSLILLLLVFATVFLFIPEVSADYWIEFLPGRTEGFAAQVSIDDQSLSGFLSRIGQTNRYSFPGLTIEDKHDVIWQFPWDFSSQTIQFISISLLILLGGWLAFSWIRSKGNQPVGILFGLVLFSLLPLPHMARYNHILALPAMAWLWQEGSHFRKLVITAYLLFGLSRLNHLWAILLPSPLGPVASGFGLFGVFILLAGITYDMMGK